MGARPMLRLIQDLIRKALADELLFGKLVAGGSVIVDLDDKEEIKLEFPENAGVSDKFQLPESNALELGLILNPFKKPAFRSRLFLCQETIRPDGEKQGH